MATLFLRYPSAVLGKETTATILFPDAGVGPFPVLYLFHGLGDDSSTWLRKTRLEVYAARLPVLIVMPDGYRGFYTNHESGPAYASHFGKELPELIDRMFPTRAERSGRAVGGFSMGGYGALLLRVEIKAGDFGEIKCGGSEGFFDFGAGFCKLGAGGED